MKSITETTRTGYTTGDKTDVYFDGRRERVDL